MLKKEQKYDFRKRMLEIHKPNVRKTDKTPTDNEFVIENGVVILLPENPGIVVETAAKESIQYFEVDSRLGWEPSMEYIGTPDRVEWKEKMMNYVLNFEIATYKKCVAHDLD